MSQRRGTGPRTIIVGGGLAGLAAASRLATVGHSVTLLERRPFLGGRAYSFPDPETGAIVDNGQHVLVGACTRLRAFLTSIASPPNAFQRQARLNVPILNGSGRQAVLEAARLPRPLHALWALMRYEHLCTRDRRSILAAVYSLANLRGERRRSLDDTPLGDWLRRRGTTEEAIRRFWEPLVRPALNARVDDANLPLTAFFMEQALWKDASRGALWLPTVGLSEALGEPAHRTLADLGVQLRFNCRVNRIALEDEQLMGVSLAGGEIVTGEHVILAVAPRALDEIIAECDQFTDRYGSIGTSSIINVYLWYDRPVMEIGFAGTFDSALQWIFNRSQLLGEKAGGEACIGVSLSAADEYIDWSKNVLVDHCDQAVGEIFPARAGASLVRQSVVKEPHATFRTGPGVSSRRPGPRTAVRGVYLAGDWTDTGWPATMEGAVRSGERAADEVLLDLSLGRPG